jgi:hypothetical protein
MIVMPSFCLSESVRGAASLVVPEEARQTSRQPSQGRD